MNLQRTPFSAALIFAAMVQSGSLMVGTAEAQQPPDLRVADLVRAGKLRVGLFLPQYGKGPAGPPTTVWVETARGYAERIGIPLVIVEHATPPEAIACLKTGACDQLFLPRDARAAEVGDFSHPVFQFDYTLMVPSASPIRNVTDADQPSVRIAAVRNHASTNELVRQIKQAQLVYADTPESTFELVRSGKADVMASTRLNLLEFSAKLAGTRVLDDQYGANINRMVVAKGNAGRLAHANEFVEEAKASGAVQKFIERGGTRGVTVAAPGESN